MSSSRTLRADRRQFLAGASAVVAATTVLAGCGFTMRQTPKFAFDTLRFAGNENSAISRALQTVLSTSGVTVINSRAPAELQRQAQAILTVVADQRERIAVNQTTSGQTQELELRNRFRFHLTNLRGRVLLEESEIVLERDISFSETAAIAKAAEEEMLFKDMQGDIVQQVLRRLASVKSV